MNLETIEGVTCLVCGKELFDKCNMKEHCFLEHKELKLKVDDNGTICFTNNNTGEFSNRIP